MRLHSGVVWFAPSVEEVEDMSLTVGLIVFVITENVTGHLKITLTVFLGSFFLGLALFCSGSLLAAEVSSTS